MKKLIGLIVFSLLFSVGINSYSKTPDGETPAVEDVCDGLEGAAFGLCNAYCEAMDCDSAEPQASDKACEKVLANYVKKTDSMPPCEVVEFCGDGTTQAGLGEECDDGNTTAEDGCSDTCQVESCGDGTTQAGLGEECDDGNTTAEDGCSDTCQVESCGDGTTQAGLGEECDDGNTTAEDGCSDTCQVESCGDGTTQAGLGEECDDGNTTAEDGCSDTCQVESCGDGTTQAGLGEECDDGNTTAEDGCSDTCQVESCGDGTTQVGLGEECDDGNTDPGDGCDANCQIEMTGQCSGGSPDGVRDDGEECDDGNNINYDICTNACTLPACGDGIISHTGIFVDSLDDTSQGLFVFATHCRIVGGGFPSFDPSCVEHESCEDGNTLPNDGCSPTCRIEHCGDGIKQDNEVCDWDIPEWLHTDDAGEIEPILLKECTGEEIVNGDKVPPPLPNCIPNPEYIPCDSTCNSGVGTPLQQCPLFGGLFPAHGLDCTCIDADYTLCSQCDTIERGFCEANTPGQCAQFCQCYPTYGGNFCDAKLPVCQPNEVHPGQVLPVSDSVTTSCEDQCGPNGTWTHDENGRCITEPLP